MEQSLTTPTQPMSQSSTQAIPPTPVSHQWAVAPQPQAYYPTQASQVMQPQVQAQQMGQPSSYAMQPAQAQGWQQAYPVSTQSQASQGIPMEEYARTVAYLARQIGQAPSQYQVAQYQQQAPVNPYQIPATPQQYQPFLQASPQTSPYPQTYSQAYSQPQTQQQTSSYNEALARIPNVDQNGNALASLSELEQAFGSVEAAALHLNSYGCQVEDQLMQVAQYAQQLEQTALYHAQREGAMSEIMTNPSLLAPYYLELERVYGDIPVDQPRQQMQQQAPMQMQAQQFQGQVPLSQFGARPEFPAPPNQIPTAGKLDMLRQAPASVAWKVLDQMSPSDWRTGVLGKALRCG
jgi:hypothetical protein